MEEENHVKVVRGWIDANLKEGSESLDNLLNEQPLFQHEGKSWVCTVTDLEGQFKQYLEMVDYVDQHDIPYEFEVMLMNLSDFWQLVSVESARQDSGALK